MEKTYIQTPCKVRLANLSPRSAYFCDVTDARCVNETVEKINDETGPVRMLVAVRGSASPLRARTQNSSISVATVAPDFTGQGYDSVLDTNVKAHLDICAVNPEETTGMGDLEYEE